MRTLAALVAVTSVLAFAGAADAKRTNVRVSMPAGVPHAAVPWTVTVHVSLRGRPYAKPGYRPTLYVLGASRIPVATLHGVRVAPGTFRVGIVFQRPGKWRYVI